jgi:hypothetical protein
MVSTSASKDRRVPSVVMVPIGFSLVLYGRQYDVASDVLTTAAGIGADACMQYCTNVSVG